jgi:hypothetical protein
MGWVLWAAGKAGWYFFALGPQMVICLALGYLSAKKTGGDLLNWLVAAFVASLIPVAGVVVMLAVWWRAGHTGTGLPVAHAPASGDGGPAASVEPAADEPQVGAEAAAGAAGSTFPKAAS